MLHRNVTPELRDALADTPVVLLNGARQTGKSTLARALAPDAFPGGPAAYVTLDDATALAAATDDPDGFVRGLDGPVILDEVQRAPELFRAVKAEVDRDRRPGRFLLTGSADVMLLPVASESLAGRMEVVTLWPLSQGEIEGRTERFVDAVFEDALPPAPGSSGEPVWTRLARGGYPEAAEREDARRRSRWFGSYVTTILQRDVRDLARIEGLSEMPRLLALVAARTATLLNVAELSRSSGLPASTLKRYLTLLQATFLVRELPAWSTNRSKRLVKSPKLLVADSGLAAHLVGFEGGGVRARRTAGPAPGDVRRRRARQAGRVEPPSRDAPPLPDAGRPRGRRRPGGRLRTTSSASRSRRRGACRGRTSAGSEHSVTSGRRRSVAASCSTPGPTWSRSATTSPPSRCRRSGSGRTGGREPPEARTALSGVTPFPRDAPSPMLRLSLPLRIARIRRKAADRLARSPRVRLPRSFGLAALLALVAFAPAQEAKAQWAVIDPAHIAKSVVNGRQLVDQLRAQRDQLLAFRENVRKLRSYNVRDVGGLIDQFDRTITSGGQLAYSSADLAREFDRAYRSFDVNDPAAEAQRVLEDRLAGSLNTLRALREHATQLQTSRRDLQGFQSQIRAATTRPADRRAPGDRPGLPGAGDPDAPAGRDAPGRPGGAGRRP